MKPTNPIPNTNISKEATGAARNIQDEFSRVNKTCPQANYVVPGTNTLAPIIQQALDQQAKQFEDVVKAATEYFNVNAPMGTMKFAETYANLGVALTNLNNPKQEQREGVDE